MASIGEQISAARRAKGMTQGDLAKALNISRSGVANYESGRRLPDAETLLELSNLLGYSFENQSMRDLTLPTDEEPESAEEEETPDMPDDTDAEKEDEPLENADIEEAVEEPKLPVDVPPKQVSGGKIAHLRRWAIACTALLAVCVVALIIVLTRSKPVQVPPVEAAVDSGSVTQAYFRQGNANVAEAPYLEASSVVRHQQGDGLDMWMYTVTFRETNGFPYNIDHLESYTFVNGSVHFAELSRDILTGAGMGTEIAANGEWSVDGGLPVQDGVEGIGFALRGTDEAGEQRSFVYFMPLGGK